MSDPNDEAIAALRHGDQQTAFTLLRARLAQHPRDATAWLWMSEATPDVRRKVEALTRFLALAPDHPHAPSVRRRLENLQQQLNVEPPASRPTPPSDTPIVPIVYEETPPAAPDPVLFAAEDEEEAAPPADETPSVTAAPSLRDRLATMPQPIVSPAPMGSEIPPPTNVVEEMRAAVMQEPVTPKPVEVPPFTPRPAAPPPPDFTIPNAEEDEDGMPMWVWILMGMAIVLVIGFIYVIMNYAEVF